MYFPLECGLEHCDNHENLIVCPFLRQEARKYNKSHADLFKDVPNQHQAVIMYKNILKIRKETLENLAGA